MRQFKGKVAVVTGAASGIGRSIAVRCLQEGMNVVLADVERPALFRAVEELKDSGGEVLGVPTDVSDQDAVERLAEKALDAFGAVHLLVNNAGVSLAGPAVWEYTAADWQWILGVNLWGTIHGIRIFVPLMLKQDEECHIVNTASSFGLYSPPRYGAYSATKHAVVSLSETLRDDLAQKGVKLKVSVLCPGLVDTNIADSARNRPPALSNDLAIEGQRRIEHGAQRASVQEAMHSAMSPDAVAARVFEAMREDRFYLLTDNATKEQLQKRVNPILDEKGFGNVSTD